MKLTEKILIAGMAMLVLLGSPSLFAGGGKETAADGKPVAVTFAHHLPPTTIQNKAIEFFAESAKKHSGGRLAITVSHSAQLGGQRELVEAARMGTIEMVMGEAGRYEAYVAEFGIFSLPFLFKDLADYHATVDGPTGTEFEKLLLDKAGLRILCWVDGGVRNVFSKKTMSPSLSSMNGVKIRTPESAIYVNTFRALGANPTPIAAPEMYSAIQSGVVDAMEGSYETAYNYKIYEVAKNCLVTGHINTDLSYAVNSKFFDKLPRDLQNALSAAGADAEAWQRKEFFNAEEGFRKKLEAEGGMKYIAANHDEFLRAVAPVYKTFADAKPQAAEMLKKMGKL